MQFLKTLFVRMIKVIIMMLPLLIDVNNLFSNIITTNDYSTIVIINEIFPYSIYWCVVYFSLLFMDKKLGEWNLDALERCFSYVCGFFIFCGYCLSDVGSVKTILISRRLMILSILFYVGSVLLIKDAIRLIKYCVSKITRINIDIPQAMKSNCFLTSWIIIIVCWMPYVILRYPGGVQWDAFMQIMGYVNNDINAHWPPASSALMGGAVELGNKIFGSRDIGLFLFLSLQTIGSAAIFSYGNHLLSKAKIAKNYSYVYVLIVAIVPIFPGYMTSAVKDAPYTAAVMLLVFLTCDMLLFEWNKRKLIAAILAALLVCILRQNGVFVIIFLALGTVAYMVKCHLRYLLGLVIGFLCVLVIYMGYQKVLLPYLGLSDNSLGTPLSIVWQTVGRYAREYPNDITDEEKEIVTQVVSWDSIGQMYDPLLADYAAISYNGTRDLRDFFVVWIKLFLKHPTCYIEAIMHTSLGYYYPDFKIETTGGINAGLYMQEFDVDVFEYNRPIIVDTTKRLLMQYVLLLENIPPLFFLGNIAVHIWTMLFSLGIILKKQQGKMLVLIIPSFVTLLVLIVGPTSWWDGGRYALPIICLNPFFVGMECFAEKNSQADSELK